MRRFLGLLAAFLAAMALVVTAYGAGPAAAPRSGGLSFLATGGAPPDFHR